ncbi:MAG TPA: hypothetical protein VJR48_13765 [Ktedonobacterales bacterium]|nr:hypothetical protein [Ktedonobacterales bacterium]
MTDEKKQRGGWFRRKGRETASTPSAPQPANSGKLAQWLTAWQERMDNANRRRDLATRLNQDLAGILATCAEQQKALNQRSMRTQVQLSMALGRLSGIVHQLDTTRAVCAYLIEATQPQLPAVAVAAGANGANGANGTSVLGAPASPSRPLVLNGNPSGPLAAPVVRDLGRGGFKRMARDLQQAFRETEQATQEILRPIQMQALRMPEVYALANALAALEPLMTWLNQRCEALTATYCAPANDQQPGTPPGRRGDFWQ